MWIFSKHGFFSAVCARQGDGGHSQPVDPVRLMVRARVRSHLEALKSQFSELLATARSRSFRVPTFTQTTDSSSRAVTIMTFACGIGVRVLNP